MDVNMCLCALRFDTMKKFDCIWKTTTCTRQILFEHGCQRRRIQSRWLSIGRRRMRRPLVLRLVSSSWSSPCLAIPWPLLTAHRLSSALTEHCQTAWCRRGLDSLSSRFWRRWDCLDSWCRQHLQMTHRWMKHPATITSSSWHCRPMQCFPMHLLFVGKSPNVEGIWASVYLMMFIALLLLLTQLRTQPRSVWRGKEAILCGKYKCNLNSMMKSIFQWLQMSY